MDFEYEPPARPLIFRPRAIEDRIRWYASLPREQVPIPPRERIRRAWRDKSPRQLWRTHDTRIVWPDGGYGIRITTYGEDA